jgi:hypothetical protein
VIDRRPGNARLASAQIGITKMHEAQARECAQLHSHPEASQGRVSEATVGQNVVRRMRLREELSGAKKISIKGLRRSRIKLLGSKFRTQAFLIK